MLITLLFYVLQQLNLWLKDNYFSLNHIYEDQLDLMVNEQLKREPFPAPKLIINPDIKTLEDLETWVTMDDFDIEGYEHHPPIRYPFSV